MQNNEVLIVKSEAQKMEEAMKIKQLIMNSRNLGTDWFSYVPNELILTIMSFVNDLLDTNSLISFACTNKRHNMLAKTKSLTPFYWQPKSFIPIEESSCCKFTNRNSIVETVGNTYRRGVTVRGNIGWSSGIHSFQINVHSVADGFGSPGVACGVVHSSELSDIPQWIKRRVGTFIAYECVLTVVVDIDNRKLTFFKDGELEKTSNYVFSKNDLSKVSKAHKNRLFPVFTVWGDVKFTTRFNLSEKELPKNAAFYINTVGKKT